MRRSLVRLFLNSYRRSCETPGVLTLCSSVARPVGGSDGWVVLRFSHIQYERIRIPSLILSQTLRVLSNTIPYLLRDTISTHRYRPKMRRLKDFSRRQVGDQRTSRTLRSPSNSDPRNPTSSDPSPPFPDGIKVWHNCPNATIDICFVHGLTGNRDSTWTASQKSTPWPTMLLPPKLPRARLLTWGYDAYVVQASVASKNRLIDHAMNLLNDLTNDRVASGASARPLIFVAHSLGGIVCKEAILSSRNNPDPHLCDIFEHTIGVVFMGTPHGGSWMADWIKIPASGLGVLKSTSTSLLQVLGTDDQLLESIQVRFWSMVRERQKCERPLEIACFFEELPLPVVGQVVSKKSATMEGYASVSVHANHRDMVKFETENDNGFKRLVGSLMRWVSLLSAGV